MRKHTFNIFIDLDGTILNVYARYFAIFRKFISSEIDELNTFEDWKKLKRWAEDNGHELVLVSAQRPHCEEPTTAWLKEWGFDFGEIHYTKNKWAVDVDVLIDDSPEKLQDFKTKSVVGGVSICMKQSWNKQCQNSTMSIDRLSDITTMIFE